VEIIYKTVEKHISQTVFKKSQIIHNDNVVGLYA
jgi:hypothetical protein